MTESDDKANQQATETPQPGSVVAPGEPTDQPQPLVSAAEDEPAGSSAGSPANQPTAALVDDIGDDEDDMSVSWTASEFIAHQKAVGWYLKLGLATAAAAAVIFWITRDMVSVAVIVAAGILLGVYGARQPRQLPYRIDARGLSIGSKFFPYGDFKSFAVMTEGAFASIVLMPLKRFATLTTIYYAPEDEDRILAVLSEHLPFEPRNADPVDRLMRRIRF